MNEDRSARYHKRGRRAEIASTAWSAGLLVCLAATPLSLALRRVATAAAEPLHAALQPFAVVLVYVACLGVIHQVGALPFAFYRSFLLERRYGLSTERIGHWIRDHAKAAGVGALLAGAGVSLLYAALRLMPEWWWGASAAGFGLVVVALTGLAPVLLLPLFFTFRPLARADLKERLIALSGRAGVPVADVSEWQISDRTKKANAALTGIGRTRRILVSDTLLSGHPDDEIEVILAHELGHQVHHDVWKGIAIQADRDRPGVLRREPDAAGIGAAARVGGAGGCRRPARPAALGWSRRPGACCPRSPRRRGPWNGRRTGSRSS